MFPQRPKKGSLKRKQRVCLLHAGYFSIHSTDFVNVMHAAGAPVRAAGKMRVKRYIHFKVWHELRGKKEGEDEKKGEEIFEQRMRE